MADVKFKRDAESGKEYISLPMPAYSVGDKVVVPTSSSYQALQYISYNGQLIRNQFMMGTIVGASFNLDGGLSWKYIVKSNIGEHNVREENILLITPDTKKKKDDC